MTIGDRIRILRTEKGWSQAELAQASGLNRNSIYKYEKNETMPRMPKVKAIAQALGVEVDILFTGQLETERLRAHMQPTGSPHASPPEADGALSLYDEYFALLQKYGITHGELIQVTERLQPQETAQEKAAVATVPTEGFFDLIATRESCRAYAERPVEHDKLMRCLEAARLSPSACNSQPWSFLAIETRELAAQTAKCLQSVGMNKFTASCGCFVAVVEEKANLTARFGARLKDQDYASLDIGIACAHFCLAATALGLSTCMVGWFDEPKLKALLSVPAEKRVRMVICVGYAQAHALRPKERKPLEEIARFL